MGKVSNISLVVFILYLLYRKGIFGDGRKEKILSQLSSEYSSRILEIADIVERRMSEDEINDVYIFMFDYPYIGTVNSETPPTLAKSIKAISEKYDLFNTK